MHIATNELDLVIMLEDQFGPLVYLYAFIIFFFMNVNITVTEQC